MPCPRSYHRKKTCWVWALAYNHSKNDAATDLIAAARMGGIPWLLTLMLTMFPPQSKLSSTRASTPVRGMGRDEFIVPWLLCQSHAGGCNSNLLGSPNQATSLITESHKWRQIKHEPGLCVVLGRQGGEV